MSYLAGPLTRGQIKKLMDPVRAQFLARETVLATAKAGAQGESASTSAKHAGAGHRPVLPAAVREKFLAVSKRVPEGFSLEYRPGLLGKARVHFVRKSGGVDSWRDCYVLQTHRATPPDDVWQGAEIFPQELSTDAEPDSAAAFAELPGELAREKSYSAFTRELKDHLYRHESLKLLACELLSETSRADEDEAAFRTRLAPRLDAKRTEARAGIEKSFATKIAGRAQTRLNTQRWQFFARMANMAWVVLDTIMSVLGRGLPGRRRSLDPAVRSVATERGQQSNAQLAVEQATHQIEQLTKERDEKLAALDAEYNPKGVRLETLELKPQKSDVDVSGVWLAWLPWRVSAQGAAEAAFELPGQS
jgi:hypothetical protein